MTWTRHGHHIAGTIDVGDRPERVARCGGPGLCHMCSTEAAMVLNKLEKDGGSVRFGNRNEGVRESYPDIARLVVMDQYNNDGIGTPRGQQIEPLSFEDVYVVWFSYTLGSWKAMVSTTKPDDRYYEVTHNSAKNETYIDTYVKTHNICRTGDI